MMRVPLLDLADEYRALADPIREKIDKVVASHSFILGPEVENFESAICKYTGARYAVGMSSGTDALLATLMCLDIGPGDAVVTTAYSFFANAACIARLGAMPIFVDIDAETLNISTTALEDVLTTQCEQGANSELYHKASGKRVRTIVPVHLFGLCCEIQAICALAEKHGLRVIEDAAQAIGAECRIDSKTRRAGTIGLAGCFSFYPTKNLGAAGDAGMVICNEEQFARKLAVCRQHGMERRYHHQFIGGNFRLDEIQAAVLNVKLPHLNEWSAARRAVAEFYRTEFKRTGLLDQVILPADPYRECGIINHHIYHQFVIRTSARDALREHLTRHCIGTAIYYPLALHEQECFAYLGHKAGDLPEAERAARESLALPIYPTLSRDAQQYVVNTIKAFFKG